MWRDKESKKIVYLEKVEFCVTDKNGNIKKVFREMTLDEIKRIAEWVVE